MLSSITKEEIGKLAKATFTGEIVVVDSLPQVEPAVAALEQCAIIGMDTESKPVFKKYERQSVALIQLSSESCCYLFRINKIGIPPRLQGLLEREDILKVGLDLCGDRRQLRRFSKELHPQGFVDLQRLTPAYGIHDLGLQKIYAILFGEKISKRAQLSNWEAATLTPAQQSYAALDAYACLRIYHRLESEPMPLLHHFGLCPEQPS